MKNGEQRCTRCGFVLREERKSPGYAPNKQVVVLAWTGYRTTWLYGQSAALAKQYGEEDARDCTEYIEET